jgi:TetR/AcrR family transcriptional regulator, cholesterol catabolism regulator
MNASKRKREDPEVRSRAILETAAKLICAKGYAGTGIQEIAEACELTKAGLYHYIQSKENLLLEIMSYGMDLFEIEDPLERLKACMAKNITLVTRGWSKEITIILHEHATLHGPAARQINARKKRYVRFLESAFQEAIDQGLIREVNPTVAAFSFLGMVLWIYKWFQPDGQLSDAQVADGMIDLLFKGLEPR